MTNKITYYFILFGLIIFLMPIHAQKRLGRENMLGGGGTNYSNKTYKGRDGLITGQYSGDHHLIGAYANGGYSTFCSDINIINSLPGGYTIGGGLIYQYQHNSFIMDIGLGISLQDVKLNVSDTAFTWYNTPDSWTNQRDTFHYDLIYSFTERSDATKNVYIQIPILIGQSIGNSHGGAFYYLAGVKINTQLKGTSSIKVLGSTIGEYDRYMGIFQEMDNHGLRKDVLMTRVGERLSLNLDVLASAEFGYEWASPTLRGYRTKTKTDWRLRIGAFIDFGLVNINPKTEKCLINIPAEYMYDFSQYEFNHILSTSDMEGHSVHNIFCGIKLTALIGIKTKEACRLCGEFGSEAKM